MKFLIFVVMLMCISAFFIISNNNIHLKNPDEFEIFGEKYFLWFKGFFDKGKYISGYLVKSDWLPR